MNEVKDYYPWLIIFIGGIFANYYGIFISFIGFFIIGYRGIKNKEFTIVRATIKGNFAIVYSIIFILIPLFIIWKMYFI